MNPDKYADRYQADYGFESVVVAYRRRLLMERLDRIRPHVVVEIGCGSELVYRNWSAQQQRTQCWVIVEPSQRFAALARDQRLPNLHVVHDFIENAVDRVLRILPRQADLVICSSLLHEVGSPGGLLSAVATLMGPHTQLHVNVPNSESLHRRLAQAMGLVEETKAMSERNLRLMQKRVYDMSSLRAQLSASGFRVVRDGGYLVKPFSHTQMEKLTPLAGAEVMDGLYELGRKMPESASEIWAEAELDTVGH